MCGPILNQDDEAVCSGSRQFRRGLVDREHLKFLTLPAPYDRICACVCTRTER